MQLLQKILFALLGAFLVAWLLGPVLIPALRKLKFGQTERDDGPQSHLKKQGTPTIGGVMFVLAIIASTLVFAWDELALALPALLLTVAYGLVGFVDDIIKVKMHRSLGLRAYQKIIAQFLLAFLAAYFLYRSPLVGSTLYLPVSGRSWDLGVFYLPFAMFVIIAEVNSVNLTDGLDGLAANVTMVFAGAMVLVCCLMSGIDRDAGLSARADALTGMSVFAAAVAGGCLGFLRHNTYPAKVFMGDTGSMALGGAVAALGLMSRTALLLPLMGVCFMASAVSVILQVGSYKLRNKKRIFRMAPLHHHFELGGVPETKIVSMYSMVTALACAIAVLLFTF